MSKRRRSGRRDVNAIASSLPVRGFADIDDLVTFGRADEFWASPLRGSVWDLSDGPDLDLSEVSDGRSWNPAGRSRHVSRVDSARARLVSGPTRPGEYPSPVVAFERPREVAVCVRREARREVLHAKGVAGGRVSRRRRMTPDSRVSCRRR